MYCDFCGARLPENSVFCPECGARLAPLTDTPPIPESKPNTPASASPSNGQFNRTRTLTEAARLAIEHNALGLWSSWDSSRRFTESAQKLLRLCEKEDRYIASLDDRSGVQYYVVSPDGAIGQVYLDDNDEHLFLEWMYYTPNRAPEELPSAPGEL